MDLSTIQKRISQLEKFEEEAKIIKEMLKGELENEESYLQAAEKVKEAVKERKQIKDQILALGSNQEAMANIKNLQEEVSTLREILSAELTELFQENDTDIITDEFGTARKFKVMAKLLPKKGEKRNEEGRYMKE